jgi:hypothetical protein
MWSLRRESLSFLGFEEAVVAILEGLWVRMEEMGGYDYGWACTRYGAGQWMGWMKGGVGGRSDLTGCGGKKREVSELRGMVLLGCLRKRTYMMEREKKILGSCEKLRRLNMRCCYEGPLHDDHSALEIKKTTMQYRRPTFGRSRNNADLLTGGF